MSEGGLPHWLTTFNGAWLLLIVFLVGCWIVHKISQD